MFCSETNFNIYFLYNKKLMSFLALTVCDGGLHLLPHSELERADVFGHINQSS